MKTLHTLITLLLSTISLLAEDKSKPLYFIAPQGAEYARSGAIHILKTEIQKLPKLNFPKEPLKTTPQNVTKRAFEHYAKRFPQSVPPRFLSCQLLPFPSEIAGNRFYYLVSLAPVKLEQKQKGGSTVVLKDQYVIVVPIGIEKVMYPPAVTVKKMTNKAAHTNPLPAE